MQEAESIAWANPSSIHQAGRAARNLLEDARECLGRALSFSPRDVIFTGGGTEANHMALQGARWLVTSRIEHPSIVAQAERLKAAGARVEFAEVASSGVVTAEAVVAALDRVLEGETVESLNIDDGGLSNDNTPLVALMAANHETGVIQPLQEVAEAIRPRRARLHVDAVQLMGRSSLAPLQYADSVAIAGHKFRGPKGIGALAFNCGWTPLPLGRGGAQERGLRPGTVDATAARGLEVAVRRLAESVENYGTVSSHARYLEAQLAHRALSPVVIHGADVPRLGHVVNFRVDGWKGDELVAALDLAGVCVSSGSACSAGTAEPSSIIEAMLGRAAATGAVRVSLGEETRREDVESLLSALTELRVIRPE